ncbi:hypothetical protein N0V90_004714 [Kalmusia sp. IMI 367209]|nr:hypothetical protein N0V90_004714 [Kalmusia sp. IMI 367209]
MSLSILSIALLASSALAAPRPEIEVVQVRQVAKRQDTSSIDLGDLLPSSIDLGDLSSLLPSSLDLGDFSTLIPSGCLPPSDLEEAPTPPPDVVSAIQTWSDYCHAPSFTGSVAEHYSSYQSEALSWASKNEPELESWLSAFSTDCPYASLMPTGTADLSSLLGSYSIPLSLASCGGSSVKETGTPSAKTTGGSGTTGSAGSAATTGSASGATGASAASGSGPVTTGAAPQQTAFAAAAGVVAGIAGIVAVL